VSGDVTSNLGLSVFSSSPEAERDSVCNLIRCPLILTLDPSNAPLGSKK